MKMHALISDFLLGTTALAQAQTKRVPQAPAAGVQYPPVMHRRPGITSRFALCWALTVLLLPIFCARGQNLLDNPGFEQGTNRWTVRASEILLATNRFHSGNRAVAIVNRTATTDGPAQSLFGKMQPGVSYFCSAWARVDSASPQIIRLNFEQQDAAGPQSL